MARRPAAGDHLVRSGSIVVGLGGRLLATQPLGPAPRPPSWSGWPPRDPSPGPGRCTGSPIKTGSFGNPSFLKALVRVAEHVCGSLRRMLNRSSRSPCARRNLTPVTVTAGSSRRQRVIAPNEAIEAPSGITMPTPKDSLGVSPAIARFFAGSSEPQPALSTAMARHPAAIVLTPSSSSRSRQAGVGTLAHPPSGASRPLRLSWVRLPSPLRLSRKCATSKSPGKYV